MSALREELQALLNRLDEPQTRQALQVLKRLYGDTSEEGIEYDMSGYNEAEDPFIKGIFAGPPDLSERGEDILREQMVDGNWTWEKQD